MIGVFARPRSPPPGSRPMASGGRVAGMSGSGAVPVSLRGEKLRLREGAGELVLVGGCDPRASRRRAGESGWRAATVEVPLASWARQARRLPALEHDVAVLSSGLEEFSALWTLGLRETLARAERRRDRARMFAGFLATFPAEALARALRFAEGEWQVLQLLLRCPQAEELVDSNSLLAFGLAASAAFHPHAASRRWTEVRRLLARRRRVVTEWLGFGGSEAAVKLLRKVPAESITLRRALRLRAALAEPEQARALAHVGRINAGVMRLALDPELRAAVAPRLLEEVGQTRTEDRRPHVYRLLEDTLGLRREFAVPGAPPRFAGLDELRAHHDELVDRLVAARPPRPPANRRRPFPPPPVPGSETIVPLLRAVDLVEEGRRQHNCIATYARRVLAGNLYVYRVLAPMRATLTLVRRRGVWMLDELLAARNRSVSYATENAVDAWLHRSRPGADSDAGLLEGLDE